MIGIGRQAWLTDPQIAMFSVIVISVWQSVDYNMLLFLAGLQSIPEALYEAAKIDGGGPWSRFRHITLPMLSPTTFFVLIITLISAFQVFNIIYIFTVTGGAEGRLRALLPQGVENLTVGGRCISCDHLSQASIRGAATCMATGHAAGTSAALAAIHHQYVRDVDIRLIQQTLIEQDVILSMIDDRQPWLGESVTLRNSNVKSLAAD